MQKRKFSMNLQGVVCLALVLLLVLLVGLPVYAQEPLAGFDEYVEKAMADWEVPGVAIAIVKDDAIYLAKGYGLREVGKEEPVDEHTVFAIGSATKAFTAASVALLVEEGGLNWDDPVIKHLPGFQLFDPWVTREITVRDLLCHRSGLERADVLWGFGYDRDEILRRIRHLEPAWSFRSRFGYQNIMFLAAGQVVAAVSGQSWDDFVMERIFTPLGMSASNTSVTALSDLENVATPHVGFDGQVQVIPWHNIDNIAPAGSINSNVVDMAQWLRFQLGEGIYEDQQLLNSASVKEMHAPQTIIHPGDDPMIADLVVLGASFKTYGLGWYLHDYAGRKVVEHSGMIDGMSALVAMIPQENLGLVILTNMNQTLLPYALMYRVFDAFLGLPERDWSAEIGETAKAFMEQVKAAQTQMVEARVEGTTPSLPLQEYAGTYVNDLYGEMKVEEEGGKLVMRPLYLEHWHYDTFLVASDSPFLSQVPVIFVLNAMGKVDEMKIQGGPVFTASFKRVP